MKLLARRDPKRTGIQIASRGEWEKAFAVGQADAAAIREWVATADEDVAVECVFSDPSGELCGFIGLRQRLALVGDRCDFWLNVIERTKPIESQGPREHIALWLEILNRPSLLESPAQVIKLGVFNQWISAGPVSLHSGHLTPRDVELGPDWIRHGATAPICREYEWVTPANFWMAEVVSNLDQGRYVIDTRLLPE
jgi:hypothetical protein